MNSLIVDAQEQINEIQRGIFKNINKLEDSYTELKNVLEDTRSLNDI